MKHLGALEQTSPIYVITVASLAAASMVLNHPVSFAFGAFGALLLVILAFRSHWLGLLAIFPLASSIRPTPPDIGAQEALFALLVAVVVLKSIAEVAISTGWKTLLRQYGKPLGIACALAIVNLAVAISHGVGLADWLRGLVPFLFIGLFIPVAQAIEHHPERLRWLGLSIGALIALLAGHVVIYYLANGLHHPYWVIEIDGIPQRIPEALASLHADARGPFLDRVTISIQNSTDVLLPVGTVAGLIVAAFASDRRAAIFGYAVSILSLTAVIMTYTRSMLLSAMLVLAIFMVYAALSRRGFTKVVGLVLGLALVGTGVIAALNIESKWWSRMSLLTEAVKTDGAASSVITRTDGASSVTTRLEEYGIAWNRFIEHPLLGNGLGAKHAIQFEGPQGLVMQHVAYIHNWPLYFLMATGVTGFLIYAWALLAPAFIRPQVTSHTTLMVLRGVILTMAIYGLFFAVFRLITFNLLLAAVWGVALAISRSSSGSSTFT
ncbi:MAG: O-antigen ligase family protein [Zoogloea sp.]|nr:O-antigen ligase family protein [Zoogloea sp.]